jgi:dTDP-glucose 4,6-dehydratase
MKILVTGGAGFIGSNFIHYWLKSHKNDKIINFDKLTYAGNLKNLKDIEKDRRYRFVKGDIADRKAVAKVMKGVDKVVHFAAESHVDRSITGPSVFIKTNVLGTHILLEEALKNKIKRFHHISTDEVYGALPLKSKKKFNEETQYRPNSPYSASKAASDMLVRAYHKTFGLPVTISNTSNNYGPYQYPEKFLPVVILSAFNNKTIPVYGDGLYVRDWIHVEDHCRGIDLILKKGKVGETYCIGGDSELPNIKVVKQILKTLNKPEGLITYVKDRPGHDRRYAIDGRKIKRLGFKLKWNFEKGLENTIDWYTK